MTACTLNSIDVCAAGQELPVGAVFAVECVPCDQGFYKDPLNFASAACVPCGSGFTTADTGSQLESQCIRKYM